MKRWNKPTRVEWISFLAMMPVLCFVLNYLLFGKRVFSDARVWMYSFPVVYIQGFFSWYAHIAVMHWLRYRFPRVNQTTKRLLLLGAAHITMTFFTFLMLIYGYEALHFLNFQYSPNQVVASSFIAVALTMLATSMWEAEYTITQLKESVSEKEKLEQLTIQHEFDTLKSQVNPHFLFNCFNTLSSLISEDPKQAEIFLNELSKVYRYLLRNNESGVSSLRNELGFIRSYFKLLQTRHGSAVELNIEIDKKYEEYLLPSLTLQLLVENAVKHNVLSKNHPLTIDIFTAAGNKLVVSNNLQLRSAKVPSSKIGLENIKSKYLLLSHQEIQILQDAKSFTVVLPLVWNKVVTTDLVTL